VAEIIYLTCKHMLVNWTTELEKANGILHRSANEVILNEQKSV